MRLGHGLDPDVELGRSSAPSMPPASAPMSPRARARVWRSSPAEPRFDEAPAFYAPTVVTGARADMRLMREEIFGPVVASPPSTTPTRARRRQRHRLRPRRLGLDGEPVDGPPLRRRDPRRHTVWVNCHSYFLAGTAEGRPQGERLGPPRTARRGWRTIWRRRPSAWWSDPLRRRPVGEVPARRPIKVYSIPAGAACAVLVRLRLPIPPRSSSACRTGPAWWHSPGRPCAPRVETDRVDVEPVVDDVGPEVRRHDLSEDDLARTVTASVVCRRPFEGRGRGGDARRRDACFPQWRRGRPSPVRPLRARRGHRADVHGVHHRHVHDVDREDAGVRMFQAVS